MSVNLVTITMLFCQISNSVPDGWQAKLEKIAAETATELAHPCKYRFGDDREPKRYGDAAALASGWSHPLFFKPALALLENAQPEIACTAARILVNYDDPQVKERLKQMALDDERVLAVADVIVSVKERVGQYLEEAEQPIESFSPVPQLLPVNEYGELDLWRRMNVPTAVQQLRNDSLSVRIQAFIWLAGGCRIVLDIKPFEEAWPLLSDKLRCEVLDLLENKAFLVGGEELRASLESRLDGWDKMPDDLRGRILEVLGRLRSQKAYERARLVVQKQILEGVKTRMRTELDPFDYEPSLLTHAFYALSEDVSRSNLQDALEWSRSDSEEVRLGGLCVLARMDNWTAAYTVTGYLATQDKIPAYLDPAEQLRRRDWSDLEIKRHYLRAINRLLQEDLRHYPDVARYKVKFAAEFKPVRLIGLLEAIAQTTQGPSGLGIPLVMTIRLQDTRETAKKWEGWIRADDPQMRGASERE